MTPPPTSIDGTDITGATIDGQEVQEITIDGQTVFSAESLPVGYSNLIAWYPFDSAFYGGSNADDCTALFNPSQSGDSTAYDGNVNGPTYQASGGVTDINAGANSGAFLHNNSSSIHITVPDDPGFSGLQQFTVMAFIQTTKSAGNTPIVTNGNVFDSGEFRLEWNFKIGSFRVFGSSGRQSVNNNSNVSDGTFHHVAGTFDGGSKMEYFVDGAVNNTQTNDVPDSPPDAPRDLHIGNDFNETFGRKFFDGIIDDVRIYDTVLSQSQINQIYQNTQP